MKVKNKSEKTTRVLLIRHCETVGNAQRIFQGQIDTGISENGKKQLAALSAYLKDCPLDALYASPLPRALLTAEAVNHYHGLPIQAHPDLTEIHGGVWEGNQLDDFALLYPEDEKAWVETPWTFFPTGGESMHSVYERIWRGITEIVEQNRGKTVCVVSHGCAIRNLICRAKGMPIELLNEIEWCDNTAISVVDFDESLQPAVIVLNDASHIII